MILLVVAENKKDKIIGFGYLQTIRRLVNGKILSELGIVVKEKYQGRGIGSKIMKHLIELAKDENIGKIKLFFLTNNYKALNLYKKYGFKEKRIIKNGEKYKGKTYDKIEMELGIS